MHLSVPASGMPAARPARETECRLRSPTRAHRWCSPGNKPKIVSELLVAFAWLSKLPARLLPGSRVVLAAPWPHARCPGWGGSGQPGLRVLWRLSRLLAEAKLLLNSKAKVSGLPPTWVYVPLMPILVLLESKGRNYASHAFLHPLPPDGLRVPARSWGGGFFKDGLQLRNHKCGGQSLSASLLTQNFGGGKKTLN